ncbi:MAG TPA: hypothetical protein VIO94_15865 [Phenylobacterium sp.]
MARIRSIHPGIYTDEAWASVSIAARWLGMGICTEADDRGTFEWKPLGLKMKIFPADAVDVHELLAELAAANIVMRFDVEGRSFGSVRNFCKHQRPKKPKAWFPTTPESLDFSASGDAVTPVSSELGEDERGVVPKKGELDPVKPTSVPPKSEMSPQMEDGVGVGVVSEAKASSSPRGDSRPEYPVDFEVCWKAYPHVKGRSSKPKTLSVWRRIPAQHRLLLLAAIVRYAKEGREPRQECGAQAMERWIRDQRYLDWMGGDRAEESSPVWAGPSDLRAEIVRIKGEDFARAYLDPSGWCDDPHPTIHPKTGVAASKLNGELGSVLWKLGVKVALREPA